MTKKERKQRFDLISQMGCCICQRPAEIHHLIGHKYKGMGMKADDIYTIGLCPEHHRGNQGIHHLGMRIWEDIYGSQDYHLTRVEKFIEKNFTYELKS